MTVNWTERFAWNQRDFVRISPITGNKVRCSKIQRESETEFGWFACCLGPETCIRTCIRESDRQQKKIHDSKTWISNQREDGDREYTKKTQAHSENTQVRVWRCKFKREWQRSDALKRIDNFNLIGANNKSQTMPTESWQWYIAMAQPAPVESLGNKSAIRIVLDSYSVTYTHRSVCRLAMQKQTQITKSATHAG